MKIDFNKSPDQLVPAVIQDFNTSRILMLGYMNAASLQKTMESRLVTFYSRSRKGLWTKGEESGNCLVVKEILPDCDRDTILIKAVPKGPVCHSGSDTCFGEANNRDSFLHELEQTIERRRLFPQAASYISGLFNSGNDRIIQKFGEESVELIIEAKGNSNALFMNEAADLLFHYLILLNVKGVSLNEVTAVLKTRQVLNKISLIVSYLGIN